MSRQVFYEGLEGQHFVQALRLVADTLQQNAASFVAPNNRAQANATPGNSIDLNYYNDIVQYEDASWVEANCNAISFYNLGVTTAYVNNVPLIQFQGFSIGGNQGEVDRTKYNIKFSGVGQNQLVIIKKVYR